MSTQLHLVRGIVEGRAHTTQDPAVLRTLQLARKQARREGRALRRG